MQKPHLREQLSNPLSTRKNARNLFLEGTLAAAAAVALCTLALMTNDSGEWTLGGALSSMGAVSHPGYLVLLVLAILCGGRIIKRWLD